MRAILLSLLPALFICSSLWAQPVPQQPASLYEHLYAINAEWAQQPDLNHEEMRQVVVFQNDEQRIQKHLKIVEKTLRSRKPAQLSPTQLKNREANLDNLIAYWQRNLFPINTGHEGRQPYFIDNYGTACAVGHLLQTSGAEDFAQKVALENNYAYIQQMPYEELENWTSNNGFSKTELAWIQPSYGYSHCPYPEAMYNFSSGTIHVMKKMEGLSIVVGGNFEASTNGSQPIRNVAYFNGYSWESFGNTNTINGSVYAIEDYRNTVYIAGDFVIDGTNFHNIAYWDYNNSNWVGVQTGNMGGVIKTLKKYECKLYVGGDFQTVNGANMPYLSAWDGNTWSSTPSNCTGTAPSSSIVVDGIVNVIDDYKGQLLIGGSFANAFPAMPANNLAVWENGWQVSPLSTGAMGEVKDLVKLHIVGQATASHIFMASNNLQAFSNGKWYAPNDTIQIEHYDNDFITLPNVPNIRNVYSFETLYKYNKNLYYTAGNDLVDLFERVDFFTYELNQGPSMRFDGPVTAVGCNNLYYNPFVVAGNFSKVTASLSPIMPECEDGLYNNIPGRAIVFTPGEPLPLELSNFKAQQLDNFKVALDWTTLSETRSSHIEIERRTALQADFRYVGQVAAAGESFEAIKYNFLDDVSSLEATTLYYRLKMVDQDGSFEYSEIRAVKLRERGQELSISPNPATETVMIQIGINRDGPATIQLYNLQGQLIQSLEKTVHAGSFLTERLDVGELGNGVYFLKVHTAGKEVTKKLLIGR